MTLAWCGTWREFHLLWFFRVTLFTAQSLQYYLRTAIYKTYTVVAFLTSKNEIGSVSRSTDCVLTGEKCKTLTVFSRQSSMRVPSPPKSQNQKWFITHQSWRLQSPLYHFLLSYCSSSSSLPETVSGPENANLRRISNILRPWPMHMTMTFTPLERNHHLKSSWQHSTIIETSGLCVLTADKAGRRWGITCWKKCCCTDGIFTDFPTIT